MLTGLPPGPTGTGLVVSQIIAEMRERGVRVHLFHAAAFGATLADAVIATQEEDGSPILLLHPQFTGTRASIEIVQRSKTPVLLYVLDNHFFCLRSYNHVPGHVGPCLSCLGGDHGGIERFGCAPYPVNDDWALEYIKALIPFVRSGRVRPLVQNRLQGELVLRHFGKGTVPLVGLWTNEMDRLKEELADPASLSTPSSSRPADGSKDWDIVFHAHGVAAKGVLWALELARQCPEERFLFPFSVSQDYRTAHPNCTFLEMSWDSELREAVETARIVLVPSLWSAPIESALFKSVLFARAVAIVDHASTYAAELPDGLTIRLPASPASAASLLRQRLRENWRPEAALRRSWLQGFRTANIGMIPKILSLAGMMDT